MRRGARLLPGFNHHLLPEETAMHAAALAYIAAHLPADADSVLEFGSRNINGSARSVTAASHYVGVDIDVGPGVDVVADAATVWIDSRFDVVVCAEVFEHADDECCRQMCANAFNHLRSGGTFVATMAGLGRAPHSAHDGGSLQDGEFYRNVDFALLEGWLLDAGFDRVDIDVRKDDIRCTAVKS